MGSVRKALLPALALVVALVALVRLKDRSIKRDLDRMIAAVEAEDLEDAMRGVSRLYSDPYGNDKAALRKLAARFFQEFDGLRVTVTSRKIERRDSRATVRLRVKLVGDYQGMRGLLVGSLDQAEPVEVSLEKVGSRWLVVGLSSPLIRAASHIWTEGS